jgi:hypothetical protein
MSFRRPRQWVHIFTLESLASAKPDVMARWSGASKFVPISKSSQNLPQQLTLTLSVLSISALFILE